MDTGQHMMALKRLELRNDAFAFCYAATEQLLKLPEKSGGSQINSTYRGLQHHYMAREVTLKNAI